MVDKSRDNTLGLTSVHLPGFGITERFPSPSLIFPQNST